MKVDSVCVLKLYSTMLYGPVNDEPLYPSPVMYRLPSGPMVTPAGPIRIDWLFGATRVASSAPVLASISYTALVTYDVAINVCVELPSVIAGLTVIV